jgi:hypothetical protein
MIPYLIYKKTSLIIINFGANYFNDYRLILKFY